MFKSLYKKDMMNTKTLLRTQMSVAKKRKRKFRSMANQEYCNKRNNCTDCVFNKYYSWCDGNGRGGEPCELPNGKYILIEVKE